ncbi:MAG: carboxypeptidase regulatory-like domain-containing protein, partial [Holophagales bacterium]|nr:carboxypeptidase regulatory-like domain-containing protein [Holophagales bacterium]
LDGIQIGSILRSTDPVQVILLTGDVGTTYEARWFAMVSFDKWGSSYYTPVDSAATDETRVILYNPGASAITVTHETRGTTVSSTETVDDTTSAAFNENTNGCGSNPLIRTFDVVSAGTVAGVRLGFNADHTYRGDIQLTLESPSNTRVQIVTQSGGDGDNNFDVLLDDTSGNPLDDGNADNTAAPFYDRTAAPDAAFTPFDGETAAGTWTLEICDAFGGDSGTYNRSQLQVDIGTPGVVTGTVSVPADGLTEFVMPEDSAAHFFTAGGEPFFALSTIDYDGLAHDWGHPLLPEDSLSTVLVTGWAPGRDPTSGTNPTENGSPIWLTATGPTTVYIDFDGDPTTGALVDPEGNRYDQDRTLGELESIQIFDTGDGDQSGTRIYTLDGTLLTAAWGQDPDTASGGAPGLDLGTVVLPLEILRASKESLLFNDVDGDGGIDPGDQLLYSIRIENISDAVVTNITVQDFGLDPNVAYIADSTELDGVSIPDDVAPATPFPLDESGYLLGSIGIGQSVLVTFVAQVDDPLPGGVEDVSNQVRVTTPSQIETGSSVTPVGNPRLSITKTSDAVGDLQPGQTVTYTVTVTNTDTAPSTGLRVLDQLPEGTAYVAESTSASGFEVTSGTFNFDNTTSGAFGNAANPCTNPLLRTFSVAQTLTVTRISLGFNASHNFRGDIRLTLQSPAGTRVEVMSEDPGDGDNNFDLLISDGSGNAIDDGTADTVAAPFYTRTAGPSNPMTAFEGESSNGTWTLEICDTGTLDDGTFNRAQLRVTGASSSAIVKANAAAAPNPLVDGEPTNLLLAPDGLALLPAQSMTITYQVTVDDPLSRDVTNVINTAVVTSLEQTEPLRATVIDPVSPGGTIGDRVWLDVDRDGIDDVGEPGIANVTVQLFDAGGDGVPGGGDDTLIATEVTGADGGYLFDRLTPGTYFVDVNGATVPSGLALTAGSTDPTATRTITAEEIFLDLDIGYTTADAGTAILGDFVWSDADADGVQDPGEPGIGGVTLELLDSGGAVLSTVVTADDGSYRFTGVAAGEYRVRVAASNFLGGQPLVGYTVTTGPQSEGSTVSVPVLLAAGDIHLQTDFGFDGTTYRVTDAVWLDLDSDGVFDADEAPLSNVTVDLLDASGDVIATVRTAADGSFAFDGLAPGSYTLSVSDHGGLLSGLGGTTADSRARQLAVTIVSSNLGAQTFGYNGPATLGDRVWSDADGDGVQDPDEVGIPGVSVELLDRLGSVIATTSTDAFGNYLFDAVLPESYSVRVVAATVPAGMTQTGDPDAVLDGQGSALLALGESVRTLDFGYRQPTRPDISGNVFEDLDVDGVDDGVGEPGFGGVTLELRDTSGNVLARTTTDSAGDYSFPDLPAGNYLVAVTDDAGVLEDTRLTSGFDVLPVTVAATDVTGIDFGYVREGRLGSIGDLVWLDLDSDGQRDGAENGLSGVTVQLWDPGPDGVLGGGNDSLLTTTTTDSQGRYSFDGLAAGTYVAQVDTTSLPGGGTDLVATTANPSATVLLSEGERYTDADFGFGSAPTVGYIGDFVWFDADADGVQDPGEAGIGGVTVELTGPGCAPCTTVTAADGTYAFPGLAAGVYDVALNAASIPAAYSPNATNTDGPWEVRLDPGDAVTAADFGLPAAGAVGTIGDTVWLDLDGDGNVDPGEPGLGGVTLALTDTGGNVLATTTTVADGTYSFSGLAAGSYRVEVTDLDGVLVGLNLVSGTNPTGTIALAAGATFASADFGYAASSGSGSIGDLVWHDLDADGTRDSGEPGMQGVRLDLWLDTNNNGLIEPGTDNLVRTTITDIQGRYEFTGLPDGNYLVDVNDTAGVTAGMVRTSGTPNTDNESQNDPYDVTLTGGVANNTADFGYQAPADLQIFGTAFFDLDGDGTQDPVDIGVEVVRVFLFRDLDGDGVLDQGDALIDSRVTVVNGDYVFTDLPPGDFIVAVDATGTFVDGATQTTQLLTNTVQPVTLVATDSTDNDFGFTRLATAAVVVNVRLEQHAGRTWLAWSTAAEAGTAGFRVWRESGAGAVLVARFVASPHGAPQGAHYRVADDDLTALLESGAADPRVSYTLEEVVREGRGWFYGPYVLDPAAGLDPAAEPIDQGFDPARAENGSWSSPRRPSARAQERLAEARLTAERSALLARLPSKAGYGPTGDGSKSGAVERVKLLVERDGLQFVPTSGLAAALGLTPAEVEAALAAGSFRLGLPDPQGIGGLGTFRPVATWTGSDGTETGLFFVGRARYDNFARHEVYWLLPGSAVTAASVAGGVVSPAPGGTFVDRRQVEEDVFAATFVARDPELDYWHWKGLVAGSAAFGSAELELPLHDVDASDGGQLTVHFRGASDGNVPNEHHAEVEIGGRLVG